MAATDAPFAVSSSTKFSPIPPESNSEPNTIPGTGGTNTVIVNNARSYNPTVIDSTGNPKIASPNGNFAISGNEQYVNSGWLVPKTQEKAYPGSSNTFAVAFQKSGTYHYGSSKEIGKAIAVSFANSKHYYGIVINSRKVEEAQLVSREINDLRAGCDSIAVEVDVSREEDCIMLVAETVKRFGRTDVLVNNAGIQEDLPLTEISIDEWYKILGVDLTGPFVCSREAVKYMKAQKDPKGGCIINISSVHQTIPKPHYVPYATSKAGLEMMTKDHGTRIC
jgi:hypothetical protein